MRIIDKGFEGLFGLVKDRVGLGETDNGKLKALLVPYPADQMRMWEISPRVNSPKNDNPSLWEPLHARWLFAVDLALLLQIILT